MEPAVPVAPSADGTPEPSPLPSDLPQAKRSRIHHEAEVPDQNAVDRTIIDLAAQKHGPKFQALSKETQLWLLKLHRNLGHPGSAKLAEFCRQLSCSSEVIQAVPDLRCSTCNETKTPEIARPSTIHPECDFGDVIMMDNLEWTNQQGNTFFMYHFLEQSTMFHTAVVAPAHQTENAIRALSEGWILWAGPPGMLCMDSGSELNADSFLSFLQAQGIRSRTIAADAHWQNGRIERHGSVLKTFSHEWIMKRGSTPGNNYDGQFT